MFKSETFNNWVLGIDVGGTFTDLCARHEKTGQTFIHKRPSTPEDPSKAIMDGIKEISLKINFPLNSLIRVAHGTTVATNALLQRKGASLALVTTKGFRDLTEIGRQIRPKVYDLQIDAVPPIIPRELRFEIDERVDANGKVIKKIKNDEVQKLIKKISLLKNLDGVAICFLFSFVNSSNEKKIYQFLKKFIPNLNVSISSDVQPEFREFERFSTTIINSFLQPSVSSYMTNLKEKIQKHVKQSNLVIFQSNGGLTSVDIATKYPVRMALSGPAAGVVGAANISQKSGYKNIITLDMGGTSTDVCLIQNAKANMTNLRDIAGFRLRLPMVDINTVGAGGGSIAYIGKDNLMKVGPESAGATPGPACYGLGGNFPTVSDANLVLGRLPEDLASGGMKLDKIKAIKAISKLAKKIHLSVEEIALGIVKIATSNMTRAIRAVSVERGYDPRNFVLMPFGGAGGLHAAYVAASLEMDKIMIPKTPGILCAEGLIVSDLRESFVKTCRINLENFQIAEKHIDKLVKDAMIWFKKDGKGNGKKKYEIFFDMRYVGQNYELSILVLDTFKTKNIPNLNTLKDLFFKSHERSYGHYDPNAPIEIVNIRLSASTSLPYKFKKTRVKENVIKPKYYNDVWFSQKSSTKTPIFDRKDFFSGFSLTGPAIILQEDATTLVPPKYSIFVDKEENIVMERKR